MSAENKKVESPKVFDEYGRLTKEGHEFVSHFRHELIVLAGRAAKDMSETQLQMLESCAKSLVGEVFNHHITGFKPWEEK